MDSRTRILQGLLVLSLAVAIALFWRMGWLIMLLLIGASLLTYIMAPPRRPILAFSIGVIFAFVEMAIIPFGPWTYSQSIPFMISIPFYLPFLYGFVSLMAFSIYEGWDTHG